MSCTTLVDRNALTSLYPTLADRDTAQLDLALELATSVVRREARQHISADTSTVRLMGTWDHRLSLPERPVPGDGVTAVVRVFSGETVDDWRLVRGVLVRESTIYDMRTKSHHGHWYGPDEEIEVTYTHGFVTVPPWVRSIVMAVAKRGIDGGEIPDGITQESIGPRSWSYAQTDEVGVRLSTREAEDLHDLRPVS